MWGQQGALSISMLPFNHTVAFEFYMQLTNKGFTTTLILDNPGTALWIKLHSVGANDIRINRFERLTQITLRKGYNVLGSVLAVTGRDWTRWKKGRFGPNESFCQQRVSISRGGGSYGHIFHRCPQICQAQSAEQRRQPVYLVALLCLSSAQDTRANVFGWNISHIALKVCLPWRWQPSWWALPCMSKRCTV